MPTPHQASGPGNRAAYIPFFVNNVDCPLDVQLSAGASCHVQVGFGPTIAGNYSGQFAILDNEPDLRHPIGVSGTANPIPVAPAGSGINHL